MRIAIIALAYLEYTIELANALAKTERVLLIIPQKKSSGLLELIDQRVEKVVMDFPRIRNPRNLYYVLKTIKRMHAFKPNVIHFQGGFLWYNAALPFLGACPLVTTIHDPIVHAGDRQSRKLILFKPNSLAVLFSQRVIVHGKNIPEAWVKMIRVINNYGILNLMNIGTDRKIKEIGGMSVVIYNPQDRDLSFNPFLIPMTQKRIDDYE